MSNINFLDRVNFSFENNEGHCLSCKLENGYTCHGEGRSTENGKDYIIHLSSNNSKTKFLLQSNELHNSIDFNEEEFDTSPPHRKFSKYSIHTCSVEKWYNRSGIELNFVSIISYHQLCPTKSVGILLLILIEALVRPVIYR